MLLSKTPFTKASLDIIKDTASTLAFDRVRAWLRNCGEHHTFCKDRIHDQIFNPTRLLDVNSLAASDQVVLVRPLRGSQPLKYACLSYCWGKDIIGILRTTKANLESHYRGFSCVTLPKSVRDAVTVCRELEIQYLWVDSFCIIQDDPEDWQRESAQMLEIYGDSHLTIYANNPGSCKLGFLGRQKYSETRWQRRLQTTIPGELSGAETGLSVRFGRPDHYRLLSHTPLASSGSKQKRSVMARCSLDARAWCLQEQILPGRRLHYDGNEMTWECCTRRLCECGHLDTGQGFGSSMNAEHPMVRMFVSEEGIRERPNQVRDRISREWIGIVEDYSSRLLSDPEDKLVAISGLATEIQKIYTAGDNQYYAGLWGRNFLQLITWSPIWPPIGTDLDLHPRPSRSATYRAPTWSWASNDGPIVYRSYSATHMWERKPALVTRAVVDEVFCELVDPTAGNGKVKAGHALLTGHIVPVELVRFDKSLCMLYTPEDVRELAEPVALVRGRSLVRYEVSLDFETGRVLSRDNKEHRCWWRGACECNCCVWTKQTDDPVFCFEVFTWQDNNVDRQHEEEEDESHYRGLPPETWFLVLRQTSSVVYERIGVGVCRAGYSDHDLWPKGKLEDGLSHECPLFEGSEVKSIRII